ncbi:hypothetical protein C8R43DRAFT_982461 [Mycena crocata]|nr:hypothetical protein C8R43DRAFT_982461 [Mycena crocata]
MSVFGAFFGHASVLFRRGPGIPGRLKSPTIPLYHRFPSGFPVAIPVLIAIDVVVIVNSVQVTWRNLQYEPQNSSNEKAPALRPWWLRVGVCSMEVLTGVVVALSLLPVRSRTGTLLSILPPKHSQATPTAFNRRIFIQNANSWRANGTIFPLSACKVTRIEKQKLYLEVRGLYGGWVLPLDKSRVDGKPAELNIEDACKTFDTRWKAAGGKGQILTV